MTIEMPPFSKIYKQREGADKFFYDKLTEVVDTVNGLTEGSTSKINITLLDDNGDGVAGAKVTLTSGGDSYSTGDTGKAGGASISNVTYGVYKVNITLPNGYSLLAKYDDVIVNSETTNVSLTVNKLDTNLDTVGTVNINVKTIAGDAIKDAEVELSNDNNEYQGLTDSEGNCVIEEVPVGKYNIIVYAEGYIDGINDLTVSGGKSNSISFVLEVD